MKINKRTERSRNLDSIHYNGNAFSLLYNVRIGSGVHAALLLQLLPWALSHRVKWLKREADKSSQSITGVKNAYR